MLFSREGGWGVRGVSKPALDAAGDGPAEGADARKENDLVEMKSDDVGEAEVVDLDEMEPGEGR